MAAVDHVRFFASLATATGLAVGLSLAQPARAEEDGTALLQRAMRTRITLATDPRDGHAVVIPHCRHAPQGCDARLLEFARYLTDAGDKHGVDPWLLAAMAFKESGFNPFAMGSLGELGILQLHPNNPRSKGVRFLHDEWYRQRCRKQVGACQREVVDRAAQLLVKSLELCGGDMDDALGAYNTGRCGGNRVYTKRILGERQTLRQAVGLER
ncbi:MAG TPA: transglycosylase SLT domain-containing protein [Polyangiales bacterium]